MNKFRKLRELGATTAENALIVSLIALGIVGAVSATRDKAKTTYQTAGAAMTGTTLAVGGGGGGGGTVTTVPSGGGGGGGGATTTTTPSGGGGGATTTTVSSGPTTTVVGSAVFDTPDAPTLVASQANGIITVQVTGTPWGAGFASSYIFLSTPDACETCYTQYKVVTSTQLTTGNDTYTFTAPAGDWQARFVTDGVGSRRFISRSNTVTSNHAAMPAAPTLVATQSNGTITVTVSGVPWGTYYANSYIFLAEPSSCNTCYGQYKSVTSTQLTTGNDTYTFTASGGAWQARFVTDAVGARTWVASSNTVTSTAAAVGAPTLSASESGGTVTVSVSGVSTAAGHANSYVFLASPIACDECYTQYRSITATNYSTGSDTYTFTVPQGTWQARFVTDSTGTRKKLSQSNTVSSVGTLPAAPTLTATQSNGTITVNVTGAAWGTGYSSSYVFLSTPGSCDECYVQYRVVSSNQLTTGNGTYQFTAAAGDWVARFVTDAPGTRTLVASSNTVTSTLLQPGTPTLTATESNGTVTVTVAGPPWGSPYVNSYIFLSAPTACDTCYAQYRTIQNTQLTTGNATYTFKAVAGNWHAKFVTDASGTRKWIASSNVVTSTATTPTAPTLTATQSNGTITVNVSGTAWGEAYVNNSYIFLAAPDACDTCYGQYRVFTEANALTGAGTYTFEAPGGQWQARFATDASGTRTWVASSNTVTSTAVQPAAPTLTATQSNGTVTVSVSGPAWGGAYANSYIFLAAPDACNTCYSQYRVVTAAQLANGSDTYTFEAVAGQWQARFVTDATGTRTWIASSNTITSTKTQPAAPTLVATESSGTVTVNVSGAAWGTAYSSSYIFLAPPTACDTCYGQYRVVTNKHLTTGSDAYTFTAPAGQWQARFVTDAPGTRTWIVSSNTVTSTAAAPSTPTLVATESNGVVTVNVTNAAWGDAYSNSYVFLASPSACLTCYGQYRVVSQQMLTTGSGSYAFDVPSGDWQARIVTDASGTRTWLASSNTVTSSIAQPAAPTLTATQVNGEITVSVSGVAWGATYANSYIFLSAPASCNTCYTQYRVVTSKQLTTGSDTYTFSAAGGDWQARFVTDASGTRTWVASSNTITSTLVQPAAPTLAVSQTAGRITVSVSGPAWGSPYSSSYIFLAQPGACNTCYNQYRVVTAQMLSTGSDTYTFDAIAGDWQARFVTDASGTRTWIASSPTITSTAPVATPPSLVASVSGSRVTVTATGTPMGSGYTSSWITLVPASACDTCLGAYQGVSGSMLTTGNGSYAFDLPPGSWQVRMVTDASGARAKFATGNTVTVAGTAPAAPTLAVSKSGTTVTVTVTGPPWPGYDNAYSFIFIDAPSACDTCYQQYRVVTPTQYQTGSDTYTFEVPAGTWQARMVTDISGTRTFVSRSSTNVTV